MPYVETDLLQSDPQGPAHHQEDRCVLRRTVDGHQVGVVRLTLSARRDPRRWLRQQTIASLPVTVGITLWASTECRRRGSHHRAKGICKNSFLLRKVVGHLNNNLKGLSPKVDVRY